MNGSQMKILCLFKLSVYSPSPPSTDITDLIVLLLTPTSFAAIVIDTATRGRCCTTNVNMGHNKLIIIFALSGCFSDEDKLAKPHGWKDEMTNTNE